MVGSGSTAVQRGLDIYIGACLTGAAVVAALVWRADPQVDVRAVVVLGSLIILAEQFPVRLPSGSTYSISFVMTIAALAVAGPAEAVIVTVLGSTNVVIARRRALKRNLFNVAQLALSSGAAGLAWVLAGGAPLTVHGQPGRLALPLLIATAVDFPANTMLVSGAIARAEQRRTLAVWRAQFRSLWGSYPAFGALGLLLAALYVEVSPATGVLLLAPLLFARHAFGAASKMREAFDGTVRTLAGALEVKDRYTRGHAERVSRLAEMTATALGLSAREIEAARYAGLLHDIGKLAVAGGVLRKAGKLEAHESDHMRAHAEAGAGIVAGIDVLAAAHPGVRHHHERVDGTGYPDGLAGDQIPLVARIVAVSDAFDALTSTRSYRPARGVAAALEELRRWAGSQFDHDCVAALQRAVEAHGWEPTPEERPIRLDPLKLDDLAPRNEGEHAAH